LAWARAQAPSLLPPRPSTPRPSSRALSPSPSAFFLPVGFSAIDAGSMQSLACSV
jgi:hypothetical protein